MNKSLNLPNNTSQNQSENYMQMYLEMKNKYEILENENKNLKNQINQLMDKQNNQNQNLSFEDALKFKLANSILGNNNPGLDLGSIIQREKQNNPDFCNERFFSWNCCFSKNTLITVKEHNKIIKKCIPEIKIDDLVLTLINGKKKFTKVKYFKVYDDDNEYKFYEFKCVSKDKVKMITVTHNHIMIVYDKDMNELKYKTAENVIKNEDYFNTLDGLYQIKEIKIFDMKYKYALGVDEGSIIADDILVSCLNMNDLNKNLSLNELIKKYNIKIM